MESNETPEEHVPEEQTVPVSLMSMPEEVFLDGIFHFLGYNNLLRLRHVCKPIKLYSDQFLQCPKNLSLTIETVRELNDTNFTFQHYLNLNLPATSIYLNNPSSSIFKDPAIPNFLHLHGEEITSLCIRNLKCFNSDRDPELHFFSNLPNLQHLDIDFLDCSQLDPSFCSPTYKTVYNICIEVLPKKPLFPQNFKNLKSLKINYIKGHGSNIHHYLTNLLEICQNLEYFKDPATHCLATHPIGSFGYVIDHIVLRSSLQNNSPNLQYYDLENVFEHPTQCSPNQFCRLVGLCYEHQVKLLNVPSELLDECPRVFERSPERFTVPLVSMRKVHTGAFFAEFNNLEKLVINSTGASSFSADSWMLSGTEPPKWPKLKSLDVSVTPPRRFGEEVTTNLVDFFFGAGKQREELNDLAIRFPMKWMMGGDENKLPVPNPRDVTRVCPFVTKLTLQNWIGKEEKDVSIFGRVCRFWRRSS